MGLGPDRSVTGGLASPYRALVRKRRAAGNKQGEIGDVAEEVKKLTVQRNGGRQQKWTTFGCSGAPLSPGGRTKHLKWQAARP